MKNEIKELGEDIRTHLEYQKMMGVEFVARRSSLVPSPLRGEGKGGGGNCNEHPPLSPLPSREGKQSHELDSIRAEIGDCKRCKLCKGRNNIVFGVGNPNAELMFVGEGPGADEDVQGEPFVGRAGQLLTKIIEAMGLKRSDVYISNVVMCRPPNNRNPEPDEIEECMPFLLKRISVIKPKIIVALGAVATKAMLNTEAPISKLRGKLVDWPPAGTLERWNVGTLEPCKLIPTYHPAFLLRNPAMKRPVWEDMQKVMKELGT